MTRVHVKFHVSPAGFGTESVRRSGVVFNTQASHSIIIPSKMLLMIHSAYARLLRMGVPKQVHMIVLA